MKRYYPKTITNIPLGLLGSSETVSSTAPRPWTTIQPVTPPEEGDGDNRGRPLSNFSEITVGAGASVFRVSPLGIWLGDEVFDNAPFSVSMAGALTSTSGTIAGWTINSVYLAKDTGTANTSSGMAPTTYPFYAGSTYANRATAPFRVTPAGALVATSATITGSITATTGVIGGWTISANAMTAGTGDTTTSMDSGGTNPAFYAGSATPASAPFRVTQAGALVATSATITGAITATSGSIGSFTIGTYLYTGSKTAYDDTNAGVHLGSDGLGIGNNVFTVSAAGALVATSATITGSITATSGTIGGWTVNAASIADSSVEASANVLISSSSKIIRLGPTSGNYITIDGPNQRVRGSTYVSGTGGAGFTIEPSFIECGDLRARGTFSSVTFQKETIASVGGNLMVSKGSDILDIDMTAADNSTLTIKGNETFAVGDLLRMKDSVDDEWLEVTAVDAKPTYTVTRDKGAAYAANTNPIWKKGMSVVNYGQSGAGTILMTASSANAPRFDVATHAGAPWTTQTTKVRIGNLNGFLDYTSDLYGIAIGETDQYLKYDATNGLRIKGTSAQLDVGTLGYIKGGQTAFDTGTGFFLGQEGSEYKFSIGDSTDEKMTWNGAVLSVVGAFDAAYPITLATYTVANLPTPIGDTGYNNATGTE